VIGAGDFGDADMSGVGIVGKVGDVDCCIADFKAPLVVAFALPMGVLGPPERYNGRHIASPRTRSAKTKVSDFTTLGITGCLLVLGDGMVGSSGAAYVRESVKSGTVPPSFRLLPDNHPENLPFAITAHIRIDLTQNFPARP
jgi:hypothetical protein